MANEIEGLRELSEKLNELGVTLGGKALRQGTMLATTPAFREIKAGAPVGTRAHKTYKGRLVAPGYLKRSIKRKSYLNKRRGSALVRIGVDPEAFYGVQFVELGTKKMDARPFVLEAFKRNRKAMESRLSAMLAKKIKQIAAKHGR